MRTPGRELFGLLRTPEGRRKIRSGLSYIALPVTKHVARYYRRTVLRKTKMIAVVGSFGKTTTAGILAAVFQDSMRRNRGVRLVESILELGPTKRHAVFELGIDGPGQMAPMVRTLGPDITVVTTIGTEHLRSMGTLEVTRHEKAMAVRMLSAAGCAILNGDDPNVMWMAGQTEANLITYGLNEGNDVIATDVVLEWPRGLSFTIRSRDDSCRVETNFVGRHFVYSFLAAAAAAIHEGVPLAAFSARAREVVPAEGRMGIRCLDNGAVLLCDYFKASYETMHAALDTLAEIPATRRFVVFGDVTEPPGKQGAIYGALGERIGQIAHRAVFLGRGYPRYRVGATRAGMPKDALIYAGDLVSAAVDAIRGELGPGDVVLIKGRDEQRLDRVALALEGRDVRCTILSCRLKAPRCRQCSRLESGWDFEPVT